jgi:Bacterial SH3 domain/WD40-like Beta Propeller Repeat
MASRTQGARRSELRLLIFTFRTLGIVLCALCLTLGCQASPTATPTLAPAAPASPTSVPTATLEPTQTLSPTEIPPTDTPEPPTATPLPPIATTRIIVNVRAGPGAAFPLIGKLARGVSRPILGKSEDSKWWQIDFEGKPGWIAADFTDVRGGTSGVPVVAIAKPPTATSLPSRIAIPRLQPSATPTADIPLSGGRIYFVVKQEDGSYTTAWVRPDKKQEIFSDVILGTTPGDLNPVLSTNATPLDWSAAAGKLAYIVGSGTQNKLQTIDQNQNVADIASHGAITTPRWFSDGKQLAYIGYDNNFQNQKIYITSADGKSQRECFGARSGETLRGLDVSPANEIVFVSNYTGGAELWKLDGNCGEPTRLTQLNVDTSAPAFSPDSKQIAFVSNQAGATQFDIYLMTVDGTNIRRLISGFSPIFSPDGNWLAFSQNGEVYIMDIMGNRIQTVAPGYRPAWAGE